MIHVAQLYLDAVKFPLFLFTKIGCPPQAFYEGASVQGPESRRLTRGPPVLARGKKHVGVNGRGCRSMKKTSL